MRADAPPSPCCSLLALLTLGEGWHNNHHRYMASARHGFLQPWELDVTFYAIKRASPRARALRVACANAVQHALTRRVRRARRQ